MIAGIWPKKGMSGPHAGYFKKAYLQFLQNSIIVIPMQFAKDHGSGSLQYRCSFQILYYYPFSFQYWPCPHNIDILIHRTLQTPPLSQRYLDRSFSYTSSASLLRRAIVYSSIFKDKLHISQKIPCRISSGSQ